MAIICPSHSFVRCRFLRIIAFDAPDDAEELGDPLGYSLAFDDGTYEALDALEQEPLLEFEMLPAFEARQVPRGNREDGNCATY